MSQFSCARRSVLRVMAFAAFLASSGLLGLSAQPPREQEDPKAKTPKKIVVDDDDAVVRKKANDPAEAGGGFTTPPDVRLQELDRAAAVTRNEVLGAIYKKFAVPFDRLVETKSSYFVKPIPFRKSEWKGLTSIPVTPLDKTGRAMEGLTVKAADVKEVDHFEKLVLDEVDRLQKAKIEGASLADQLAVAEKLLQAALRFHDFSRTERRVDGRPLNLRRGAGWDEIRKPLADKLRAIQPDLLRAIVATNDAARLRQHTTRLLATFAQDAEVMKAVAAVQVAEADRLLKTDIDADAIAARRLLDELDASAPGAGGEPGKKLRQQLRDLSAKALARAKEKQGLGDERSARDLLAQAASFDPDSDGVRDMQRLLHLDYPILYVGVRQFPEKMSPATARLDSEKQAVELMFESLLEEVPDESGAVRYRPGAALTMPLSVPGGRDFLLRAIDRDPQGRPYFDAHDVVGTVEMLRAQRWSWAAYPTLWLSADPPIPHDNNTAVRIGFGMSHPDPRTAFTFKLLPARWMTENGRTIDDQRYAESPFGTGPFKLNARGAGSDSARELVFVNNPMYGRWQDRTGLPSLREVRLVEAAKIDTVEAFQSGKLHILPDVPTKEIERYSGVNSTLRTKVDVVTAANNRRVYMLAVNLRRDTLQNKKLRQGFSAAIDRDDILRQAFRPMGRIDFHRSMTGPFPPGSWAASRGPVAPPPLFNKDLAVDCFTRYLQDQGAKKTFELLCPDDSQSVEACTLICKQIASVFKPLSPEFSITPQPVPLSRLLLKVQEEHTYDLAYVPFDYPDDWYPFALSAALDPQAVGPGGRGGRNWFGFLTPGTNPDAADQELGLAMNKIFRYRDFSNELVPQAVTIAKLFDDSLPFIPLWQLDRHTVISKKVKVFVDDLSGQVSPRLLNPTTLFQGVGRWRLE